MQRLIVIALTLLIAYLAVGVFFRAVQERFLFYPKELPADHVFSFDAPFDERFFDTPHDGRIHALHFRVERPKGVVLYSHGNADDLDRWGELHPVFTRRGWDVLFYDYRGFGKSTGERSEAAMHADVAAIYDALADEYGQDRIIVYGRSMGSGVSVPLAAARTPRHLILETPYASIADVARRFLPIWPVRRFLRYRFESADVIDAVECPIHILHGTDDTVVPYSSGQKLFRACGPGAEMVTVVGGGHSDLADFPVYDEVMDEVLR